MLLCKKMSVFNVYNIPYIVFWTQLESQNLRMTWVVHNCPPLVVMGSSGQKKINSTPAKTSTLW